MVHDGTTSGAHASEPEDYAILVLLVDDQLIVGEAVRRALAGQPSLSYHFCSEPSEALATAERIRPTVILQDLVMPGVDGLTLVRQYRQQVATRDVPIIVLSSKEEPAVKGQAFAAGANDYLVKLPDSIELIARVRHHSKAYIHQCQRDAAYLALRESQQKLLELNLELQRINRVDGLTGLANRHYLDEVLATEWARAAREGTPLSVLMIDIDDFKKYNDTYGHVAGDDALKRIAKAVEKALRRPADVAARYGGEEFIAVLPSTPLSGAQVVGEHIRTAIAELAIPHRAASAGPHVTTSVGCATASPKPGTEVSLLIEAADRALYDAKHLGKDRVVAIDAKLSD